MALYVSSGRRMRRTIMVAGASAIVSLGVGVAIGRQQVPSIADRVRQVKTVGTDVATGVERLDIEYEQTLDASGSDSVQAGVLTPLDELRTRLQTTFDRAPWLSSQQRAAVLDDLAAVSTAAKSGAAIDTFRAVAQKAGANIRTTLGVPPIAESK